MKNAATKLRRWIGMGVCISFFILLVPDVNATNLNNYTLESGSDLYEDDVTSKGTLRIEEGATMIIYGNLRVISPGLVNVPSLEIYGTLIVLGDLIIDDDLNIYASAFVGPNGVMVVGGEYSMDTTYFMSADETNEGTVYLSDGSTFDGEPSSGTLTNALQDGILSVDIVNQLSGDNYWTGMEDGSWDNTSNWYLGIVPVSGYNVIINSGNGNALHITSTQGHLVLGDLTITSGEVILEPGAHLSIDNLFGVDNGLTMQNTIEKPSSLIVSQDASPSVNVQWDYVALRWWYTGHAITGNSSDDYDNSFTGTNDYKLYVYQNSWVKIPKASSYIFNSPLSGFGLMTKEDGTLITSGVLNNNSEYQVDISSDRDYLIANPYPCYLDLGYFSEANFGGADPTIYIRTTINDARAFEVYNWTAGYGTGTSCIAPGQSFWIVASGASTFTLSNALRVHSDCELKSVNALHDFIEIKLSNDYYTSKSAIFFHEYGSENISSIDSKLQYASGVIPNIYSLKEDTPVAISLLPRGLTDRVIHIGFEVEEAGNTSMVLSFDLSNLRNLYEVHLHDNTLGLTVDLNETPMYSFTSNTLSSNDRFELEIKKIISGISTQVEDKVNISEPKIYLDDNKCLVDVRSVNTSEEALLIQLFDINGNQLLKMLSKEDVIEFKLPQPKVLYIVSVTSKNIDFQKKVISE